MTAGWLAGVFLLACSVPHICHNLQLLSRGRVDSAAGLADQLVLPKVGRAPLVHGAGTASADGTAVEGSSPRSSIDLERLRNKGGCTACRNHIVQSTAACFHGCICLNQVRSVLECSRSSKAFYSQIEACVGQLEDSLGLLINQAN